MKKILIVIPKNTRPGQPSYERVMAFSQFFSDSGIKVYEKEQPCSLKEKIDFIKFLLTMKIKNVFISMPQFRNWWLFLLPRLSIILDIRDGWSIAMKTGYGGNVKPSYIKAWVVSKVERFAIRTASLAITCTPSLQRYLSHVASKNVLLILNSYSDVDQRVVQSLKKQMFLKKEANPNSIVAVCVGQFSEYGRDKAEKLLKKLSHNYQERNVILKLIGAGEDENHWIHEFIVNESLLNLSYVQLPRMGRKKMYREILDSDIGVTIIRDPDYDFGTKVFDYILCGKPIFNYFENENNFVDFFFKKTKKYRIRITTRKSLLRENKFFLLDQLI
jgi:hypothetical protein